jgi:hypothetical protein
VCRLGKNFKGSYSIGHCGLGLLAGTAQVAGGCRLLEALQEDGCRRTAQLNMYGQPNPLNGNLSNAALSPYAADAILAAGFED